MARGARARGTHPDAIPRGMAGAIFAQDDAYLHCPWRAGDESPPTMRHVGSNTRNRLSRRRPNRAQPTAAVADFVLVGLASPARRGVRAVNGPHSAVAVGSAVRTVFSAVSCRPMRCERRRLVGTQDRACREPFDPPHGPRILIQFEVSRRDLRTGTPQCRPRFILRHFATD